MYIRALLAPSLATLLLLACSSSSTATGATSSDGGGGGGGGGNCGSAGRSGKSDCYKVKDACSAGQYCANGNGNGCGVGCTSDDNCGSTEHCIRCGMESVGTCQSCSDTTDHCKTTPTPDAGPTDPCSRDTNVDFMCTSKATPKAYDCVGNDPIQTGCVKAMGDPTVFCCPM